MQNKLPNVFIQNPELLHNHGDSTYAYLTNIKSAKLIEYVPKSRLDVAVAALKEIAKTNHGMDCDHMSNLKASKALEEIGE
jgi:hypothetical protein